MFSVHRVLVLQPQPHNDDAWRQQDLERVVGGCFAILSAVFVAEGSFDELCDQGRPRGVLLEINQPNWLAMVRHER